MFNQKIHNKIASCAATFDCGTVYCDGGVEYTHGLSAGSADCTCGYGRHYRSPDGGLYPSLWDCPDETVEPEIPTAHYYIAPRSWDSDGYRIVLTREEIYDLPEDWSVLDCDYIGEFETEADAIAAAKQNPDWASEMK